jgi:hypothetical protein
VRARSADAASRWLTQGRARGEDEVCAELLEARLGAATSISKQAAPRARVARGL